MFVETFIRRPVLTIVCSIIILLVGAISIPTLPVEQYPDISPVQVVVSADYIGASAQVVEETVTTVIEREINGVTGMRYISSNSSDDGTSSITVTFQQGYNLDIAAVDVLNRVSIVTSQLPEAVQRTGVNVRKQSSSVVLGMAIYSEEEGLYDNNFISNYADLYVLDALLRIEGVAEIQPFGERRYAMRLWLDPAKMAARNITAQDLVEVIEEQNLQVGAGSIGQPPAADGQSYQLTLRAKGRLEDVSEFEDLVLKTEDNGTLVYLRDVGRAELGAESYSTFARYRRQGAIGYRILQTTGHQRPRGGKCRQGNYGGTRQRLSPRTHLCHPLRPLPVCGGVEQRSGQYPAPGDRAGCVSSLPLSAKLAGHHRSSSRDSGGTDRHLCLH